MQQLIHNLTIHIKFNTTTTSNLHQRRQFKFHFEAARG